MRWTDDAIVLSARKHGESSTVVHLFTRHHGCHAGLVRGGTGRRMRGVLQPGNDVRATWRARLEEHLGNLSVELVRARAARLLDDPLRLAALSAACAMCEIALPEREAHISVFESLDALLGTLDGEGETWAAGYVRWELGLLGALGFGLDLSSCAATGRTTELVYVSPRSGRAVSVSAGEPYRDKLLALPGFLLDPLAPATARDLLAGLSLTEHFLVEHLLAPHGVAMPPARTRLVDRLGAANH